MVAYPASRPVGDNMLQFRKAVAGAAMVPGQIVHAFGSLVGVVQGTQNIAATDPVVLAIDGVYSVDCATGTTASAGDNAWYDTSTNLIVTAGGAGIRWAGTFVNAKISGQLEALVHLNGQEALGNSLYIPVAAQNAMTAAGAVSVATYYTTVNTTTGSGHASTLADGVRVNQLKKIQLIVDAGDLVLTPANLAGGTTVTFADAGDYAVLIWNGADWVVIELGNGADGATAPVIA